MTPATYAVALITLQIWHHFLKSGANVVTDLLPHGQKEEMMDQDGAETEDHETIRHRHNKAVKHTRV